MRVLIAVLLASTCISVSAQPSQVSPVPAELEALARDVVGGNRDAMKRILERAEAGDMHAQQTAGLILLRGRGVPRSEAQAISWFRKAAEQGYLPAMHNLAVVLDRGPPSLQSRTEALLWYRKAAEQGYARSQSNLAYLIVKEGGVEKLEEARAWIDKAVAQNEPLALYMLGSMLLEGRGVQKDEAEGVKLVQRGAEGGEREAQYRLALLLGNGQGLAKDEVAAVSWLRRAAEQGYPEAQLLLGALLMQGRPGLTRDPRAGVNWLRRAARQDNVEAQYALGVAYAEGRGVARDMDEAVAWFTEAAKNGHAGAIEDLARGRARAKAPAAQSGKGPSAAPQSQTLRPSPWGANPPPTRQ